MLSDHLRVLGRARPADFVRLTRRMLGLQYLRTEDFSPTVAREEAERLRALALRARGEGPAPILVLGVMPRSGTNFVRDLLARHPGICADPGRLYEFPLLHAARGAAAFTDEFISYFPRNAEVLGRWDTLAMLAGGWLRELQHEAGSRRILLKCPHVQNLPLAPLVFPGAKIILCLRDGRDVIDSSLRTFSRWSPARKTFRQLGHEWRLGTEAVLRFSEGGPAEHPDVRVVRYEDLVADPVPTLKRLLQHADLAVGDYDFSGIGALPVRGSSRAEATGDRRWQPQAKKADFNPVNRWMRWNRAQRARFDRIAGQALEGAGYERHG